MKLKWRLMILLIFVGAFASVIFSVAAYQSLRHNMIYGADKRLETAAYAVAELFPPAYHRAIRDASSVDKAQFLSSIEQLSRYANRTGMAYVYTYMLFDGKVVTTATSATQEELADGTHDVFFQHYHTAPDEVYAAFADGLVRYLTYEDRYGEFRSIFLPMETGDGRYFVIGADLDLEYLQENLRMLLLVAIAIGSGVFMLTLLVALIGARPLVRPLVTLSDLTEHLMENSFQLPPTQENALRQIGRRRDEVGTLAKAQMEMVLRLRRFLEELEKEVAARERTESELAIARSIQLGMLPQKGLNASAAQQCELDARMIPAREVGGDFYDYFMLDEQRLFLAIGDVSGKGPGAALFMAVTRTLIKSHALSGGLTNPAALLNLVNNELVEDNPKNLFVTVIAGVLDLHSGVFTYADGGHDAPLIVRADGRIEDVCKEAGIALGVFPEFAYQETTLQLYPGDVLILFTDGVTEAMGPQEKMFSRNTLRQTLAHIEIDPVTAQITLNRILETLEQFCAGEDQSDDITLLAVNRHGALALSKLSNKAAATPETV